MGTLLRGGGFGHFMGRGIYGGNDGRRHYVTTDSVSRHSIDRFGSGDNPGHRYPCFDRYRSAGAFSTDVVQYIELRDRYGHEAFQHSHINHITDDLFSLDSSRISKN